MDIRGRILLVGIFWTAAACAAERPIDAAKSRMTVRVYKSGMLSAFAHDHEIAAPIKAGTVDTTAKTVEVRVEAASLKVRDPKVSDSDRAKIQSTMVGPEVLDAEHHSEIVFRSTSAEPAGQGNWTVHGNLTIHGQTHPVDVEVRETGGRYEGSARLRQSEFGIQPIKIAGGTVRVKDEIRIEFEIQLAR